MSFDVCWEALDASLADSIRNFLNDHFSSSALTLPEYVGDIVVNRFDFGSVPPDVSVSDMADPWVEFYLDEDLEEQDDDDDGRRDNDIENNDDDEGMMASRQNTFDNRTSTGTDNHSSIYTYSNSLHSQHSDPETRSLRDEIRARRINAKRGDLDLQLTLTLRYDGDMTLEISANMFINSPTPKFLILPVSITLKQCKMDAKVHVAFLSQLNRVFITLEPIPSSIPPPQDTQPAPLTTPVASPPPTQFPFSFQSHPSHSPHVPSAQHTAVPPLPSPHSTSTNQPAPTILKDITIESSIGAENKHVMKNVGKIEKFILEQTRKGIESMFQWPNYHVIDLVGNGKGNGDEENGIRRSGADAESLNFSLSTSSTSPPRSAFSYSYPHPPPSFQGLER